MSQVWEKEGKKGHVRYKFSRRGLFFKFLFVIFMSYLRLKGSGSLPVKE
jgi:hypothetical protein